MKPETLKMWALGLHICSRLEQDIADITEGKGVTSQETYKEETKARIRSDAKDQESIHIKLELCIDPLNPSSHPFNIVSIVSGKRMMQLTHKTQSPLGQRHWRSKKGSGLRASGIPYLGKSIPSLMGRSLSVLKLRRCMTRL